MRGHVNVIGYVNHATGGVGDHTGVDSWAADLTSDNTAVYPVAPGTVVWHGPNCDGYLKSTCANPVSGNIHLHFAVRYSAKKLSGKERLFGGSATLDAGRDFGIEVNGSITPGI